MLQQRYALNLPMERHESTWCDVSEFGRPRRAKVASNHYLRQAVTAKELFENRLPAAIDLSMVRARQVYMCRKFNICDSQVAVDSRHSSRSFRLPSFSIRQLHFDLRFALSFEGPLHPHTLDQYFLGAIARACNLMPEYFIALPTVPYGTCMSS